jgi:hypothetical protein
MKVEQISKDRFIVEDSKTESGERDIPEDWFKAASMYF